jgi:hypothetical protein
MSEVPESQEVAVQRCWDTIDAVRRACLEALAEEVPPRLDDDAIAELEQRLLDDRR